MQTFKEHIKSIAERKAISLAERGKAPNITFTGLACKELEELILVLFNEDEGVRECITNKIDEALEDAYNAIVKPAELEDDLNDMKRFIAEDAAARARDMNADARGGY